MKQLQIEDLLNQAQGFLNQLVDDALLSDYQKQILIHSFTHQSILTTHKRGVGKKTALILLSKLAKIHGLGPVLFISPIASSYQSFIDLAKQLDVNVAFVSGNNNHQFRDVLTDCHNKQIDFIFLTIEQFINPAKIEQLVQTAAFFTVFVDQAHACSIYNIDYRVEYEKLDLLLSHLPNASFIFDTSFASKQDIKQLLVYYPFIHHVAIASNTSQHHYHFQQVSTPSQQIQAILYAIDQSKHMTLIIALDFKHADWLGANLQALGVTVGVIHRKVEETTKVATIDQFTTNQLDACIITFDTELGYDHEFIDSLIFTFIPLTKEAINIHAQKVQPLGKIHLLDSTHQQTHASLQASLFPMGQREHDVFNIIKKYPQGITMREIEHEYNIDSYALEKIVKALKLKNATEKVSLAYRAIIDDLPNNQMLVEQVSQYFLDQHEQLIEALTSNDCFGMLFEDNQFRCGQCSSCLPSNNSFDSSEIDLKHHTMIIHSKKILPKALYPMAIIPPAFHAKPGFALANEFNEQDQWVQVMIELIVKVKKDATLLISLHDHEVSNVSGQMVNQVSKATGLKLYEPFKRPEAKIVQVDYKNPYHAVKAALECLKLQSSDKTYQDAILLVPHLDQGWMLTVASELLLSQQLVDSVIPIAWSI